MSTPTVTAAVFRQRWPRFKAWLEEHGSEVRVTATRFELARFTTDVGVGIIYLNRFGQITSWIGGADGAWDAYIRNGSWRAREATPRDRSKGRKAADWRDLSHRDGPSCVYCGAALTQATASIDHVVSVTNGGPDNLANKVLACREHNAIGGALPLVGKVRAIIAHETAKAIRRIEVGAAMARGRKEKANGNDAAGTA